MKIALPFVSAGRFSFKKLNSPVKGFVSKCGCSPTSRKSPFFRKDPYIVDEERFLSTILKTHIQRRVNFQNLFWGTG